MKIAISGKMCSGKTTVSNFIINELKKKQIHIEKISFADPIKDAAINWFNMSSDPKKKDRVLLQQIGRKMREIDENVWVNALITRSKKYEHLICDDVRFENEANALRKDGFIIIRLNVDRDTQIKRLKKYYKNYCEHLEKIDDISENSINSYKNFDYEIVNNYDSQNELFDVIKKIIMKHV